MYSRPYIYYLDTKYSKLMSEFPIPWCMEHAHGSTWYPSHCTLSLTRVFDPTPQQALGDVGASQSHDWLVVVLRVGLGGT